MQSFGAVYRAVGAAMAEEMGDEPALVHGDEVIDWRTFDQRTDALAAAFLESGARPGDRVAHLMRNSPAYLLTTGAAFKARMVHVNVNYRYTGPELLYILANSDSSVVVFDAEFADVLDGLRAELPNVRLWLQVGGTTAPFAQDFEAAATSGARAPSMAHDPADLLFIYTGGTTGLPKGVMWEQSVLWQLLGAGAPLPGMPGPATLDEHVARILAGQPRRRLLALPPLMHGTGLLMGIYALALGGMVITSAGRGFDPREALALSARHQPDVIVIVGDAFARPLLRAIEAGEGTLGQPGMMISSGTMWSPEVKAGLIAHCPGMICYDAFGSSEGLGLGAAISTAAAPAAPTRFAHDGDTMLIDEDDRPIAEAGVPGRVARAGLLPLGYWRDAKKTAQTFRMVNGQRCSVPGDWGVLDADGFITLLGRGSQCINSGGEKIFPEEVEEALKTHPAVEDALVFGVADERWGQAVTAVVETAAPVDADELKRHVRDHLAAYKAPKRIVFAPRCPRAPNGKADYAAARALAEAA